MSRAALSAICALVMFAPLAGCGWVGGRCGTGEPEWRFPETYIDYPNEARYITLDEGGGARVGDIPNRDARCAESSEKNISGEGVWAATGYGVIQIKIADRVIQIRSGTYRGVLDWGRIHVAFCVNDHAGGFREFFHTGYAMEY